MCVCSFVIVRLIACLLAVVCRSSLQLLLLSSLSLSRSLQSVHFSRLCGDLITDGAV